ncbi:MAG: hypothetical protein U0821_11690 [Chloroflexota bacterium]
MRGLVGDLGPGGPNEVTLLDTEASIEHMTRGTVRTVDAVVMVTEPYFRSLETTARLAPLARELGVKHVWAVANKTRSERDDAAVREYCARREIDVIAIVPFDEQVTAADVRGVALIDHAPACQAVAAVAGLATTIESRLADEST